MSKIKVLVFGNGLLGRELIKVLRNNSNILLSVASRSQPEEIDGYTFYKFDAAKDIPFFAEGQDYIINTIVDKSEDNVENSLLINSLFPIKLARNCLTSKIIHISTNGVFKLKDASDLPYGEFSEKNALSVYGKTKGLGEVLAENVINLRASFIGRQDGVLKWFLEQPDGGIIDVHWAHFWNGITNVAFAKIINGIINNNSFENLAKLSNIYHIIPANEMTKGHLLGCIKDITNKNIIVRWNFFDVKDLTLSTIFKTTNEQLWRGAGYNEVPIIENLIMELF